MPEIVLALFNIITCVPLCTGMKLRKYLTGNTLSSKP